MAVTNQGNNFRFVQKDLSEIFLSSYADFESMIPALYTIKTPDQAIINEQLMGDAGAVSTFDGDIPYDEMKQSYLKQVQETEYAKGIKVTKKFRRNDLYGVVKQYVATLADRFRDTRESVGASVFTGAFDTHLTADGVSLCNSTHTSDQDGGINQSNAGTSVLSAISVEATRQLMIKFRTNRNNKMPVFPDLILCNTDNEEKAWEIISSVGKVETANNNRNFHRGKYKLAVWHNYLNSDDWFLISSKLMKIYLGLYEWDPVQFMSSGEFDTITTKHAGYMSIAPSATDWGWIYGHNPA
jgi:hypothetical protein